jgi:hypothetical protein
MKLVVLFGSRRDRLMHKKKKKKNKKRKHA